MRVISFIQTYYVITACHFPIRASPKRAYPNRSHLILKSQTLGIYVPNKISISVLIFAFRNGTIHFLILIRVICATGFTLIICVFSIPAEQIINFITETSLNFVTKRRPLDGHLIRAQVFVWKSSIV